MYNLKQVDYILSCMPKATMLQITTRLCIFWQVTSITTFLWSSKSETQVSID